MDAEFEAIWIQAQDTFLCKLKAEDIARLNTVTSQKQLIAQTHAITRQYKSRKISQLLSRSHPFLATLHSFSEIIKEFLRAAPVFTGLIWGLLYLGIEVRI